MSTLGSSAQFIPDLVAEGGERTYSSPTSGQRKKVRQLIHSARTNGLLPEGKKLTYTGRDHGPLTIRLIDDAVLPTEPDKITVKVPTLVNRYHPSLAATVTALKTAHRDERGRSYLRGYGLVSMDVSRAHHTRALRLLHALYAAAGQHGYEIQNGDRSRNGYADTGQVGVFICSHQWRWEIRIVEKCDSVPHVPTSKEIEAHRRNSWNRIPEHDYIPNGQLEIRIEGYDQGHRSRFGDGKRSRLEDKLGNVIASLNGRMTEKRTERDRALELDRLYEHARGPALERAREAFTDDQLREHAGRQIAAANRSRQMRRLANEIQTVHPTNTEWVDWIRREADRHDPVPHTNTMPQVEPPAEYELSEYTRSWPETRPYWWKP